MKMGRSNKKGFVSKLKYDAKNKVKDGRGHPPQVHYISGFKAGREYKNKNQRHSDLRKKDMKRPTSLSARRERMSERTQRSA